MGRCLESRRAWVGLATCVLAGCRFTPAPGEGQGDAPAGAADARLTDAPLAIIDASCASTCADASTLVDCVTGGEVACPLGCLATGLGARCAWPVPSNGVGLDGLTGVTAGLIVEGRVILDSSDGSIDGEAGAVRGPGAGVIDGLHFDPRSDGLAVLSVLSLEVRPMGALLIVGDRPLVLLSAGDITIRGVVDGSAGNLTCNLTTMSQCGGPGGGDGGADNTAGAGCSTGGAGFDGSGDETGGGGGGYGAPAGGDGGASGGNPGGAGGDGLTCPDASLVPLVGGSGGGGGGGTGSGDGGVGGGGGGGLQLTALGTIWIETTQGAQVRARIEVNGGGGEAGGSNDGGGGGGAGGGLLLEAQRLVLNAAGLFANAGAGGAGDNGGPGADGGESITPAAGGAGTRPGGAGAARDGTPGAGGGMGDGTGGGGGGIGRIRLNVAEVIDTSAVISPVETRTTPVGQ